MSNARLKRVGIAQVLFNYPLRGPGLRTCFAYRAKKGLPQPNRSVFAVVFPQSNLIFFMYGTVIVIPIFTGVTSLTLDATIVRNMAAVTELAVSRRNVPLESAMEEGVAAVEVDGIGDMAPKVPASNLLLLSPRHGEDVAEVGLEQLPGYIAEGSEPAQPGAPPSGTATDEDTFPLSTRGQQELKEATVTCVCETSPAKKRTAREREEKDRKGDHKKLK